jgi:dTDP-4-dehydrorhamnose 3,5-epimerase
MGDVNVIHDVVITPLKRFPDERGTVMHIMKAKDPEFKGFGEVYGSTIYPGVVKGWHLHQKIQRSYIVLTGMIKLVLFDEREESPSKGCIQEIFIGELNYCRVTIPPEVWSGFKCIGTDIALVCDIIDQTNDSSQVKRCDPHNSHIPYDWKRKER